MMIPRLPGAVGVFLPLTAWQEMAHSKGFMADRVPRSLSSGFKTKNRRIQRLAARTGSKYSRRNAILSPAARRTAHSPGDRYGPILKEKINIQTRQYPSALRRIVKRSGGLPRKAKNVQVLITWSLKSVVGQFKSDEFLSPKSTEAAWEFSTYLKYSDAWLS